MNVIEKAHSDVLAWLKLDTGKRGIGIAQLSREVGCDRQTLYDARNRGDQWNPHYTLLKALHGYLPAPAETAAGDD